MFIERNLDFAFKQGTVAMITMQSWMFLSSFEKLRDRLLDRHTIFSMAHLGARAFDSIGGEVVSTTAFVLKNAQYPEYKGGYVRLIDGNSEAEKDDSLREAIKNPDCGWFYRASAADFKKIPGSPIAYWVKGIELFENKTIGDCFISGGRNKTHNNEKYLRFFWEVGKGNPNWICYANGGDFRKYAGNELQVVDWSEDARQFYDSHGGLCNPKFWDKEGITWSLITSAVNSFRIKPYYSQYSSGSPTIFNDKYKCDYKALAFLNTPISRYYLKAINPTLNTTVNDVFALPFVDEGIPQSLETSVGFCIRLSSIDWDAYETSWDFTILPLLDPGHHNPTLEATYAALRAHWRNMTLEMQRLEEENNRIFIEAYGLEEELTPEVPLREITLTCNPYYRYSSSKAVGDEAWDVVRGQWDDVGKALEEIAAANADAEGDDPARARALEIRLLEDTMKEFISYAVGCMFGRYSLDKPGLVLANQGETLEDYLNVIARERSDRSNLQTGEETASPVFSLRSGLARSDITIEDLPFTPDEDNVIPVLDEGWFADDIAERFKKFLRVTFGKANFTNNLAFIESALKKDIRTYFLKDFYKDHIRTYKKRPIYWLFSSPRGSFNALIYMHRYNKHTVSVILNDYLVQYRTKLNAHKAMLENRKTSAGASQSEKTKALKEIERINKVLSELREYEDDILYPLATRQIEIDLDDGVKANYPKFGRALKKVAGLSE